MKVSICVLWIVDERQISSGHLNSPAVYHSVPQRAIVTISRLEVLSLFRFDFIAFARTCRFRCGRVWLSRIGIRSLYNSAITHNGILLVLRLRTEQWATPCWKSRGQLTSAFENPSGC